jgi:phosphotriesterase-related protein
MASVMTVRGPVSADSLGITLPHEHLFIDLRNQFTEFENPEKRRISHKKLHVGNLGVVRRNPYAIKDNLLLDDLEVTVAEVGTFAALGGKTIVDCTSIGIHRDPEKLYEVARRTGLNVIAGCGYYTHDTHPAEMDQWSAEKIADDIVSDLTVGIDGTGIKAGVIGEIGTSEPIHPNEKKSLLAATLAFRQMPVAIYVHIYPWGKAGLEAADLLVEQGVNPAKIVICHSDVELDLEYIRALLKRGVFVEFDNFAKEFTINPADRGFAGGVFVRDIDRVRAIKEILDWGYEEQILVTNDICLKCILHHYGGWGYDHVLRNVVPMMLDEGISRETIDRILNDNPKQVLAL